MGFGDKVLFFFSALGAFNGLILGIYFIFFTSRKHLSDYFLGALLLVLSIRIGKSVAYFFDYNLPKIYLQIGLTACFFIGPFLYFFIKSEINQIKNLPKSWIWQLVFWFFIIVLVGAIYPYASFPPLWGCMFDKNLFYGTRNYAACCLSKNQHWKTLFITLHTHFLF